MRITWANISKRCFSVSNVGVTQYGFGELNTSDWLQYVWALLQNRWRLRQLHILKYATQLSCILQKSHCCSVTVLFGPFAGLFILAVCVRAFIPKFTSIFWLVEQALRMMPIFTEWSCANSCEVIFGRQSKHSSTWASASWTLGSRCIFHILLRRRSCRRVQLCRFCMLIHIVSETTIVSFWTLLVTFPFPTIS